MKENELLKRRLADTEVARAVAVEQAGALRVEYQQEIVRQVEVAAEEIEKLEKTISSLLGDKVNLEDRLDVVKEKMEEEVVGRVTSELEAECRRQAIHKQWLARDKSMQIDQSQQKDKVVQTVARTYSSVLAQTDGKGKGELNTADKMEIDVLASPTNTANIPTTKGNEVATPSEHSAKAFALHGVACVGPMAVRIE